MPRIGRSRPAAAYKLVRPALLTSGATGTGSLALLKPSLSGTGTAAVQGTGSLALVKPALSGTGVVEVQGTGSLALLKPSLAGTGSGAVTGTGSLALVKPSLSGAGGPVSVFGSLPAAPTYPLPLLDTRVELNLGGTWTDITSPYVYERAPVTIIRGHADEQTTTTPSSAAMTLNNRDGRFSDLNPTGPWYGQIGQNTPLRISVPEGASYLRSEVDQASYAQCPDAAGLDITGDMEIQLDISLDNWNSNQTLACKWAASSSQATWILELLESGQLRFNFSSNGTGIDTTTSTVPVPVPPLHRMCLRVTYASATGTVTYYTSPPGLSSPSWTQLGGLQSFGSAISLFSSAAPVQLGFGTDTNDGYSGIYGKFHAFQLLSGIAGTAKASPDFTAQTAGPLNANPYFTAGITSWSAFGTGAAIAWTSAQSYQGKHSLLLTTGGAAATPQAAAEQDPVTAGASYAAAAWVYSPQGCTAQIGVNWWASGVNTGGVYPAAVTIPPGTWVQLTCSGAAIAGADHAQMFAQMTGTPASTVQLYVNDAALTALGFADGQGNIWSLNGTAEISSRKYRYHGEVSAWPQSWDPTGTDVTTEITASGILRRLGANAGGQLFASAMYRAYVRLVGSTAPVAYWPCEDGAASTQLASALGGPAMQVSVPPQYGGNSAFLCSNPVPTLVAGSEWFGSVPPYTGGTDNVMRFLMAVPAAGDTNGAIIASMYTSGPVWRADLVYSTGGALTMNIYSATGALIATSGVYAFNVNGLLLRVSIELQASGADLKWNMAVLQPGASSASVVTNTLSATAVGHVTRAAVNTAGGLTSTAIGQVSVQPVWDTLFDLNGDHLASGAWTGALNAWQGEAAGNRFARLCGEEGIGFRGRGSLDDTVAMGPQLAAAVPTLLQECADADLGAIAEPRQMFGLSYRTRASMLNQPPAVTLSYTAAHLSDELKPTRDDQQLRNDVTVSQGAGASSTAGSSSEQVLASGLLSVLAPPNGAGRYPVQATINVNTAGQLDNEAAWLLHMGTVNQPRYPLVQVNLERSEIAAHYWDLQDMDLGDYLQVTSTPLWLPPDGINQLLQGATEICYGYVFHEAWACVPQAPWNTAISDDLVWGHADTDGSTVHASISNSATSMQVDTTNAASPLWTTSAGDFPFDILVSGERITVTNITGSSSPQAFTITRSVNGVTKAQSAGTDVRLFFPPIASL